MKRLTQIRSGLPCIVLQQNTTDTWMLTKGSWKGRKAQFLYGEHAKFISDVQDILGDDYDLDRLKVMVNQCMTMREEVAERFSITKDIPIDRLRELVEAELDRRCVVLPVKIGTHVWSTVFCRLSDDGKEHPTFPWEFSVSMMDEWGTGWHLTEKDAEKALEGETHDNSL